MAFLGIHIMTSKRLQAIKDATGAFVATEADQVVTALKQTAIGVAVAADIAAIKNAKLSGTEKFASVLASTIPVVLNYAVGGGIAAAAKDVEDIARALVQSVYNDVASTSVGKLVGQFLKLLGIK